MNKIIVRISEGLGNQLFMYANAYALSEKTGYQLLIDNESAYFKSKDIRNYHLDNFNISGILCKNEHRFNSHFKNLKRKFLIKTDIFKNKKLFLLEKKDKSKKTKYFEFSKNNFANLFYIEGHYESEKYFIKYKNELQNEFTLKNDHLYEDNKYLDLIKKSQNVISICIRQNRYSERSSNKFNLDNKIKSLDLTKKTLDYIKRAVNFTDNKFKNPKYLVWSNDFSNLRNYLPENKYIFVENKMNKTLTDFYLLLNCKNFIVGPTSFHWWPAWLNSDKNSFILRPKDINISNNIDFWPENWISI